MHRKHVLLGYVGLVLATPIVIWWLLPDLSEDGGTDRILEPPGIPGAIRSTIGLGATAVLLVAGAVVFSPAGRRLRRPADAPAVVPLLLALAYIGFTYRVATAAVSGANIGGGMFIMVGVVFVPTLVLYSAIVAGSAAWRRRRSAPEAQPGNGAGVPHVRRDMDSARSVVDWRIVLPLGVLSVVTMPITAIWFLLLTLLTSLATTIYAAVTPSPRLDGMVRTGVSIGLGLLPGPAAYLAIAALV